MNNLHGIYRGWYQVAAVFVLQMLCLASVYTAYSVIALPIGREFGASAMVQVLGVTVTTLSAGLLSPVLGVAVDRLPLKWLMSGSALWFCSGFFAMSWTSAMWQVLLVYAVFMAPATVLLGSMASAGLLSRWFNHQRARALGVAATGVAVGGLLLPPLLQWLIELFQWRVGLRYYGAALALVMLPVAWGLIKGQPSAAELAQEPGVDEHHDPKHRTQPKALNLRDSSFWLLAISLGFIFCGPIALTSNMLPLLVSKGIDASTGVFVLSLVAIANFAGKVLVAWRGDRVPHHYALSAILATLGLAAWVFVEAQSFAGFALAGMMVGVSAGGTAPLWSLTLSRLYGSTQVGRAMGMMRLAIMPFTLSAVPLLGWVFDRTGSYDSGFTAYVGLAALGSIFILFTGRRHAAATIAPLPRS
ncbi:MFS transporter [Litorivivens sp.]|uniref:MFS transporter n=2 Tax=Litorivivens sp. TaxID=2020868 RepID=UPI0035658916